MAPKGVHVLIQGTCKCIKPYMTKETLQTCLTEDLNVGRFSDMQSHGSLLAKEGDRVISVLVYDVRKTILTVVDFADGGRGMSRRMQTVSRN